MINPDGLLKGQVAVVTGGNRGIGLGTVRGLLKSDGFSGDVFLTARDETRRNRNRISVYSIGVGIRRNRRRPRRRHRRR